MRDLDSFLADKAQLALPSGFEPLWMPGSAYPFQADLLSGALTMGRQLLMADCGTGKSLVSLAWARNVTMKTNKPVLIATPLAVGRQFVTEGEKFDIPCARNRDGKAVHDITITNYENLHKFDPADFGGFVGDESGCIKNFQSKRKTLVGEFTRTIPYRLLATATAAPNDFKELGTSSEVLGHLGYMDMLAMFFINDEHSLHPSALGRRWRFKRAAEQPFWRWACSWLRAMSKPSDLGYDDGDFALPPINVRHRIVANTTAPEGFLPGIVVEAKTLEEQRDERKRNISERCQLAAEIACSHDRSVVIWTDYNAEADLLVKMISGAKQVSGSMSDDKKEEVFAAFASGELRVLVTKPKIGAWGLNWQHCHDVVFFVSHSFEQWYQSIRRCWRFGQLHPVTVDVIATPGERRVLANLKRKSEQAEKLFSELVKNANDPRHLAAMPINGTAVRVPDWLTSAFYAAPINVQGEEF